MSRKSQSRLKDYYQNTSDDGKAPRKKPTYHPAYQAWHGDRKEAETGKMPDLKDWLEERMTLQRKQYLLIVKNESSKNALESDIPPVTDGEN